MAHKAVLRCKVFSSTGLLLLTLLVSSVKQGLLLLWLATDFCLCSSGDLAHLVQSRGQIEPADAPVDRWQAGC